jgi:predicted phosphodiesterase
MHYAVLSDVHSNLEALDAVLADIQQKKIRDLLFIGDAVGYGPNPNECLNQLAEKCKVLLAGNHDWGAVGLTDISYFNEYARYAVEWTQMVITEENKKVLKSFPITKELRDEDILLVHSTPKEPGEWHYFLTLWDAEINFQYFNNKFCFLGHSHQPFIIEKLPSGELMTYKNTAKIRKNKRYIINAGSVGQPRDGDPRACYAVINDEEVALMRVSYDIVSVQKKMKKEKLPFALIERLSVGR